MTTELSTEISKEAQDEILSRILMTGDISGLTHKQQWDYYQMVCSHVGVNPVTQPFIKITRRNAAKEIISEVLYATKKCGDQLIKKEGLAVDPGDVEILENLGVARCKAVVMTPEGRRVKASAYVTIDYFVAPQQLKMMRGDDLCNQLMKCETKAVQRAVMRSVGLGMPSETGLDTQPECYVSTIDQELAGSGKLLNMQQRKEVQAWWRNAIAERDDIDYENERAMAKACLKELNIVLGTKGGGPEAQKAIAEAIDQAIDEVLEVARLDQIQTRKTSEAYSEDIKAIPEQAAPKPDKELSADQLSKALKWLDKKREKDTETSPTVLVIECLSALKYAGNDVRANQLLQAWMEANEVSRPKTVNTTEESNAVAISQDAAEPESSKDGELAHVDANATTDPVAEARAITPQIGELTGRKKPLNERAARELESALATIHQMRSAIVEREGDDKGKPVHPSPSWLDVAAPMLRRICDAANWPKDKATNAFKHRFRLHGQTFNDPNVLTWDLLTKMVIHFASHNPNEYEIKD